MSQTYTTLSNEPARYRSVSIDAARGLAIVLVIIGHALEILFLNRPDQGFSSLAFTVWRAIYSGGHVPAFFVIAGLVANPKPGTSGRSALQMLFLIAIWHLIGVAVLTGFTALQHPSANAIASLAILAFRPFVLGTGFAVPALWFLLALVQTELLWAQLRRRPALLVGVIVALNLVAACAPREVPNLWGFKSIGPALAFYALGAHLKLTPPKFLAWGAGLCLVVALAAAAANRGCAIPGTAWCAAPGFQGRFAVFMAMGFYGSYPLFLVAAAAGAMAILGLGVLAAPTPLGAILAWAGRRSLDLYLINGLVTAALNPVLKIPPLSGRDALAAPLVAAVAVVAQVALAGALVRIMTRVKATAAGLADKVSNATPPAASS